MSSGPACTRLYGSPCISLIWSRREPKSRASSSSWFPNTAAHGIRREITGAANLASTDVGYHDVPCPFSWSPVKTTRSGRSSSSARSTSDSVYAYAPPSQGEEGSRQGPAPTEKWRSAICMILKRPSCEKCKGGARGGAETTSARASTHARNIQRTFHSAPYGDRHALTARRLLRRRWGQPLKAEPRIAISVYNIQLCDQGLPFAVRHVPERLIFPVPQEKRRSAHNAVAQREPRFGPIPITRWGGARWKQLHVRYERHVSSASTSIIQELLYTVPT